MGIRQVKYCYNKRYSIQ